jgi:hypothetical protein
MPAKRQLLYPVPDTPEEPVDIGALMRAERNDPERWRRVHEYDGPVVCWQTRVRRWWRK